MSFMMIGAGRAGTVVEVSPLIAISANDNTVSVARSLTTPITYTLARTNYTGTVTPAVTGLPSGVTGTWSDSSLTGADTTTILTLAADVAAGLVTNDAFTVTFSGSGVSDAVDNGTVTVTAALTWTAGAGANAPSWSGKTTYPIQQFATTLPVHYAAADANGYKGFSGFPGAAGETWTPTRVEYPTVATPLGTQQVFQLRYPGQVESITANGQSTTVWRYAGSEYTNLGVKIAGTWSGTLAFEASTDGTTWTALSMYNPVSLTSVSSTTSNAYWIDDSTATRAAYDYFRVKATSWASGTATVTVGMRGAQSPANASFGSLTGNPTRVYIRVGFKTSSDWTDNGNTGTKLLFFSQTDSGDLTQKTNHYINLTEGSGVDKVSPGVGLQFKYYSDPIIAPSQNFNHGEWHDLEVILHAGTAGNFDGIAQVWMDGIQVANSSGIKFFDSLLTPRFTSFWFDPTFGGGYRPPVNQTIQIAQFYYESAA